jgi:hypothetical protein
MEVPLIIDKPRIVKENGQIVFLVKGRSLDDPNKEVDYGILQSDLIKHLNRKNLTSIAQFESIVIPGLIKARHLFRGLKRFLFADGSKHADVRKFVHSWRPKHDYVWEASRIREVDAPPRTVFGVIVEKNALPTFSSVYGWIEKWNWIRESFELDEAPFDWVNRYDEKIFTKKGA